MKIGILGSGGVGQVLATAFKNENHEVVLATRNPSKDGLKQWMEANQGIPVVSYAEAGKQSELLVLAVKGSSALEVLTLTGKDALRNKIVIDACNPIIHADNGFPVHDHGVIRYFTNANDSLMEQLQNSFPDTKFVKAFNSVGNNFMYKPNFSQGIPTMFICGNDSGAKEQVTSILTSFGWEIEDMGGVEAARPIEALCQLWCAPGFIRNQWTHAFKLFKM